jgi:quercetin dioxygenase-like cupin family protein
VEQIIQPHNGPPPHIHHKEDEAFYVLDGEFTFLCGDLQRICETGSFVYIPKHTLHTFQNTGGRTGKLLVIITPAGLEEFFYAIGTPAENFSAPPPFDPGVIDKLMRLAKEYQLEILAGK